MVKTYIKLAYRNLLRNKISTVIHSVGLSIGIVSTLMILFYVDFEKSYEDIHAKAANIYRITLDIYKGNEFVLNDAQTYQTLGSEFKEQMPEVVDFVRMFPMESMEFKNQESNLISYENRVYFADESVFNIFSFDFLGEKNLSKFKEPFKIVISESIARKYFDKTDVVGERLSFSYSENPLEIVGVMRDSPQNTHLKYDVLISHVTLPSVLDFYERNIWNAHNEYTFLLMRDGVDLEAFNQKLLAYSKANVQLPDKVVIAEPIKDIHLYSNKTYEPEVNGNAQTVNFLLVIGLLIIVLAWINYINLSTAKAMDRAKEVGIRKTIGSSKSQLIVQFFSEAFLTNLLAGITALLAFLLLLPYFREFTKLDLNVVHFGEVRLALLLVGVILFGTLVSGFYPALVLSGFKPISVLKGRFSNTAKGVNLRKGLVYVQFVASVVLLCVTMAVFKQMQFLNDEDLGVEIDNTIVIRTPRGIESDSLRKSLISAFESQALQNSWVKEITMSSSVPGTEVKDMHSSSGVRKLGEDESQGSFIYYDYGVAANYPEAMGIELLAGKFMDPKSPLESIWISEKAMENIGFATPEEAIGQKVTFYRGENPSEIQGVFKNFHQRSPKEAYMALILYPSYTPDNLIVKLNTADSQMAVEGLGEIWHSVFSGYSYDFHFLSDTYHAQYQQDQQFAKTVLLFTLLSILIAGLGLFGLSAFMVQLRTKEIGVRTVLGASKPSLLWILSRGFMGIVSISGLLSIPISYYIIQAWLDNYASQFNVDWSLFVPPLAFILVIAILTVGTQTLKSAYANPVKNLRSE